MPLVEQYIDANNGNGTVNLTKNVFDGLLTNLIDNEMAEFSLNGQDYIAYSQSIPKIFSTAETDCDKYK